MLPSLYILSSDASLVLVALPRIEGATPSLPDPASRLLPPMRDGVDCLACWQRTGWRSCLCCGFELDWSRRMDTGQAVQDSRVVCMPNPLSSLDRRRGASVSELFGQEPLA